MSPALIALLAQAILQYGLPAVLQIINNMQKPNPTEADWTAAFALAQTPYGLTPRLGDFQDLGLILPPVAAQLSGLAEFDVPPGTCVIVKVTRETGVTIICNSLGNCWSVADSLLVSKTPDPNGEIWTLPSGVRFFILKSALA